MNNLCSFSTSFLVPVFFMFLNIGTDLHPVVKYFGMDHRKSHQDRENVFNFTFKPIKLGRTQRFYYFLVDVL